MSKAAKIPPGVTMFCDPPLKPAMAALALLSARILGAEIAVLCAPPGAMLAQLQRHTRNDVLFTLRGAMDEAVRLGLVRPATRRDGFSVPLALACRAGDGPAEAAGALARRLAGARIAVTDATVASGLDGRKILAANGLLDLPYRQVCGTATTADAAFMLATGAVDAALLYRTEILADRRLATLAALNADPSVMCWSAAVNAKAVSPHAGAVLGLMQAGNGRAALRAAGMELAA